MEQVKSQNLPAGRQESKVNLDNAVRPILFTFIIYLGLLSQIFAQEFTASVNETTVADNERFQVTFTFW